MTNKQPASEQIISEVTSWPGVEAGPGKRGEYAFKFRGREIGHLQDGGLGGPTGRTPPAGGGVDGRPTTGAL